MSETPPEGRAVRQSLRLRWSEERQDALAGRVAATYRRRRARKQAAVALAIVLAICFSGYAWRRNSGTTRTTLADGSTIENIDPSTRFVIGEQAADHTEIRLEHGRARFAVTRNAARAFRVRAGDVDVEVVGTVFEVDRQDGRTRVAVSEGRVRVTRGGLTTVLGPGDERDLDTSSPPPPVEVPPPLEPDPVPHDVAPPVAAHPTKKAAPSMSEILREVDRLRLAADAKAAVSLLRHAVHDRPNDALLPQALFALGRILQDDQHDAGEAAKVFAELRTRAPHSVLVEDALAREVECLVAIGAMERARAAVRLYDATYKHGVYSERLRKLVLPR